MQEPHPKDDSKPSKINKAGEGRSLELHLLEEFAGSMAEFLKISPPADSDSFEIYAHQLRVRLLADVKIFRRRFLKGYQALLEMMPSNPQKE